MSAGFGFSVGDIVAGIKLIKQSIEALQDTKGSSADYQALTQEIDSLKDGLEAIQDLELDQQLGLKSKQSVAIQDAVSRCWRCIDDFLSLIAKYQPWLRARNSSNSIWRANLKKIQWALCKKDDVDRFRAQLERHCSSLNMLLVTLQVYRNCRSTKNVLTLFRCQSFDQSARQKHQYEVTQETHSTALDLRSNLTQATGLLVGLNLDQRRLFQTLIESNQQLVNANDRMVLELRQMRNAVQLQHNLPPQIALQKPVVLLDACGQVSSFHLDFINCVEAFLAVLRIRFQQRGVNFQGIKMLEDSQFVLRDYKGEIDLSKPWNKVIRPNQKVDMSMIFRRALAPSTCPVCQYGQHSNEDTSDAAIEW